MIEPTNARMMWYQPGNGHTDEQKAGPAWGATVAHVHNNRLINICAFTPEGNPHPVQNVPLLQDDDKPPKDGSSYCFWMPYQIGQAVKHDAEAGDVNAPKQGRKTK